MSQCFLIKKYAAGSFTFEDEIFREFVLHYIKSFVDILKSWLSLAYSIYYRNELYNNVMLSTDSGKIIVEKFQVFAFFLTRKSYTCTFYHDHRLFMLLGHKVQIRFSYIICLDGWKELYGWD